MNAPRTDKYHAVAAAADNPKTKVSIATDI